MTSQSITKIGYGMIGVIITANVLFVIRSIFENIQPDFDALMYVGLAGAHIFLVIWMSAPFIIMSYDVKKHVDSITQLRLDCVAIFIVFVAGLYMYADVLYIHPDAQGAIALLIIPILQIVAYTVLTMVFDLIDWFF